MGLKTCMTALCVFLAMGGDAKPASDCHQFFSVLGITKGRPAVLFYHEYRDGDCQLHVDHAVFLSGDSAEEMSSGRVGIELTQAFLRQMPTDTMTALIDSMGLFRVSEGVTLRAPVVDTSFKAEFARIGRDHAMGTPAGWEQYCRMVCFDSPLISGATAKLVYKYRNAIYKNYTIDSAWYVPVSGYLIVTTHQSMRADGLDTMHGVLIFGLIPATTDDR